MKKKYLSALLIVIILSSVAPVASAETQTVGMVKPETYVALSMGGQMAFPNSKGKLTLAKFQRPKVTAKTLTLTFIQDVGPGKLYYNRYTHKYVWYQTQGRVQYTVQVVVNGIAGQWMGGYVQYKQR